MLHRLQDCLSRQGPAHPPAPGDPAFVMLARDLTATLAVEIAGHFRFEEEELFPALAARGEADIGELMTEEHKTIAPVSDRIAELTRNPDVTVEAWIEFHRLGGELVERLASHIQKEEMGLVPLLEELLDAEEDARLSDIYTMQGQADARRERTGQ